MRLTSQLSWHFAPAVRERGHQYFRSGAVKIIEGDPMFVEARVRGGSEYRVVLDATLGDLVCECDCPYEGLCKHIWATILESEARGVLGDAVQARSVEYGYDSDPGLAPVPPERPSRFWQSQLAGLRLHGAPASKTEQWPAGREVLYVVDTRAYGTVWRPFTLITRTRDPKKTGGWTKPKDLKITRADLPAIPSIGDREILTLLAGSKPVVSSSGFSHVETLGPVYELHPPLTEIVLPKLFATGRIFRDDELTPIVADEGEPWTFALRLEPDRSGNRILLDGKLSRGEETAALSDIRWLGSDGSMLLSGGLTRLESANAVKWIRQLLSSGAIAAPAEEANDMLLHVIAESRGLPLTVPDSLAFERVSETPRPALRIDAEAQGERVPATLEFRYGQWFVRGSTGVPVWDPERRLLIERDAAVERESERALQELGLTSGAEAGKWNLRRSKLANVATMLLKGGWIVHIEGKPFRQATGSQMEVTSGIDWFDLTGTVSYGQAVAEMPALLEAIRKGHSIVALTDGTYGVVPPEWMDQLGRLAEMGQIENGAVRFSRVQTGLLDALLAADETIRFDEGVAEARKQIESFRGIAPVQEPSTFVGTLREYQREGVSWMQFLQGFGWGGCLADDMGLGKTAQVLALLEQRRLEQRGPSLVVVPKSLVFNWKAEAARFTPEVRVLDYTGAARSRERFHDYDIVLTTYGTLRRDVPVLREHEFDYVVLDEAQAIKNANTDSAKAVRLLRGKHRLAMSGTPIENHLGELWSLFEFLNPGMLGPVKRDIDGEGRQLLARALRPFILRRTKKQVASELPERTEQTLWCELDAMGRKLYDELRSHYRNTLLKRVDKQGLNRSKMHVLEALLRLRQAACHPGLLDPSRREDPSAKVDMLVDQLSEVTDEGNKALVFSQFTTMLGLVRERLDASGVVYEYLDGGTTHRQRPVERFQTDPDCRVFLISLKAGGLGLNLTAAEYVYLLDPWWNPAVEAQAIDRAHRIGQTKPVFAYRLIARDTVEEKVLELQRSKRELAAAIIAEDNSLVRDLKREDLELLLS